MRYLFYLILVMLISCQENNVKNSSGYFSNPQFSLDTVLIDSGDEIIFLQYQLLNSDLNENGKHLYNFNENDVAIEKINLDELSLEKKLPFEREGPNGIGTNAAVMKIHSGDQITITGMFHTSLFSLDGKKLNTVYYENFSLGGHPMEGGEQLGSKVILDTNTDRLYGLIYRYEDNNYVLGILNLKDYEVSKIKLKSFEKIPDYTFKYTYIGKATVHMTEGPKVGIERFGNKVILSNEIISTLMWYDTEMDSLFIKTYNSQLTANQKEKEYKKNHETSEAFQIEYRKYRGEINFLPLFWDKKNQVFYRFSYEENEEKTKVYLTAYDRELNQLGESLVPQLIKKPAKHFAKDGKIWIYENINDEMGFVVLTISD
ncbi:DUF4221 family protein [Aquiflexum sp.]|uniref:DUF4221 family protein n=1 Tax=Aquiflexum sp. TaxID=1872584 RepID=UPI0035948D39